MTTPLLTLVVPVYNVAPYLPRCLESLSALQPPADEIIVVDDGSTDDCPRILTEWGPRLPQMRVVRQENGGLSAARNTGLSLARGQYLAFVDSDDFVEPDAYRDALTMAQCGELDMVLFNARFHFEGRQTDRPIYSDAQETGIVSGREWLRQRLRTGRFPHMVWMHLYRRAFISEQGFRFVPRLIHEDVIWSTQALLAARRIRFLANIGVNYRIPLRNPTQETKQKRLELVVDSSIYNARALAAIAGNVADDNELQALLHHQLVDGALSIFHLLGKMPDRDAAERILRELRHSGFLGFLWRDAKGFPQHRRLLRHWLRSFVPWAGR